MVTPVTIEQVHSGTTVAQEEASDIDSPTFSTGPEPITRATFDRWMESEPVTEEGAMELVSEVEPRQEIIHELHQVQIGSLLDPRLRVQGILVLEIERDGEFYIATCDQFDEYDASIVVKRLFQALCLASG